MNISQKILTSGLDYQRQQQETGENRKLENGTTRGTALRCDEYGLIDFIIETNLMVISRAGG